MVDLLLLESSFARLTLRRVAGRHDHPSQPVDRMVLDLPSPTWPQQGFIHRMAYRVSSLCERDGAAAAQLKSPSPLPAPTAALGSRVPLPAADADAIRLPKVRARKGCHQQQSGLGSASFASASAFGPGDR